MCGAEVNELSRSGTGGTNMKATEEKKNRLASSYGPGIEFMTNKSHTMKEDSTVKCNN